jgi:hypothetical protein
MLYLYEISNFSVNFLKLFSRYRASWYNSRFIALGSEFHQFQAVSGSVLSSVRFLTGLLSAFREMHE